MQDVINQIYDDAAAIQAKKDKLNAAIEFAKTQYNERKEHYISTLFEKTKDMFGKSQTTIRFRPVGFNQFFLSVMSNSMSKNPWDATGSQLPSYFELSLTIKRDESNKALSLSIQGGTGTDTLRLQTEAGLKFCELVKEAFNEIYPEIFA